jgi:hypothetical protein
VTRSWSPAAEAKLRRLYCKEPLARLAFLLKRTPTAIKQRAVIIGINRGLRRPWSRADDKILRKRFPHERTATLAKDLGRTVLSVHNRAHGFGLSKSAAYLASPEACRLRRGDHVGAAYRFPKGHVPANKGLRRPGYSVGRGRMHETQFKKGQKPHTYRFKVGDERINTDGYIDVKIREDLVGACNWRAKHRMLWEEKHGPVPPGHLVVFKDGKKLNCVLENLELITLADNLRRNSIWKRMPKELASLVMLRAKVVRQINKRDPRAKVETHERRKAARRALRHALRTARQGKPDGDRAREGSGAGR